MTITLTRREREICVFILLDLSSKEMSKRLLIYHRTVEHHMSTTFNKFKVHGVAQLLAKLLVLA